jgi:predicted acetyltransferase
MVANSPRSSHLGGVALRLRPLLDADEANFLTAHRAMLAENFYFALGYQDTMTWQDYLVALENERVGRDLDEGRVPSTLLAALLGRSVLVGRVSIRHELNDFLEHEGGHIGFAVLAEHRRRGYASEMLRQGLVVARSLGIDRVLVTCDAGNVGSATVIARCGGQLASTVEGSGGTQIQRYWID